MKILKLIAVSAIALMLCSCSSNTECLLSSGTYSARQEESAIPPSITLDFSDNTFTFTYDVLSSYLPYGSFERDGSTITAETSDGEYTYIFEVMDNETIAFVQKGSSDVNDVSGETAVADGMEFMLDK